MLKKSFVGVLLSVLLVLGLVTFGYAGLLFESEIPIRTITIDGMPEDWDGLSPWITDPQGDIVDCEEGTDFKEIYLAKDDMYLYWRIDMQNDQFSFGTDFEKFPMIHFYDVGGQNGSTGGVKWQMWHGDENYGAVLLTYGDPDWTWIAKYVGIEYGIVQQIAEGKIPLELLNDFEIDYVMAFYYAGLANVASDSADYLYTPPRPCPADFLPR